MTHCKCCKAIERANPCLANRDRAKGGWQRVAAVVIIALGLATPRFAVADEPCLADRQSFSGELRLVETRHPMGQFIRNFHLHLGTGVCVTAEGLDGRENIQHVREIQIVPSGREQQQRLSALIGATLTVRGHFEVPPTVWYTGEVALSDGQILNVTDRPGKPTQRPSK
jgi:hypothetical protein